MMNLELYYESIDYQEISRFVLDKKVEDVYIEFKRAVHVNANEHNKNSDKKNLSKCLSGFANSDGGIVIWGVKATQKEGIDYASKLVPIKELKKFVNRLNALEGQAVSPIVEGVKHEAILCEGEIDEGYVKTYVPKSSIAPHMANYSDKHYYKRSGDSFYMAEHYDIVDMFARNSKPILQFKIYNILWKRNNSKDNIKKIEVTFAIENIGKVIAKFPYLSLSINPAYKFSEKGLDGNGFIGLRKEKGTNYWRDYSGGNKIVVYPNIMLEVDMIIGDVFFQNEHMNDLLIKYQIAAENMECIEGELRLNVNDMLKPKNYSY